MPTEENIKFSSLVICFRFYFRKECEKQVKGFKGPQFKKFNTREEAEEFIQQKCGGVVDKRKKPDPDSSKKEREGKPFYCYLSFLLSWIRLT